MLTRCGLLVFLSFCAVVWLGTNSGLAQNSVTDFHTILRDKAAFDESGFAALEQGLTVVRLLPVQDKREVAVCGLVGVQVPAEVFLQSFREGMVRKLNPAILEIGRLSATPTVADLQNLTFENGDLDDMKECVVGDCNLKLSSAMIESFHKQVNLQAADYPAQASQLLKQMLLEYVKDYLARGEEALIEYKDKPKEVRLAEEQRSLISAASYINDVIPKFSQSLKGVSTSELNLVDDAIVWSKIKFGLKPVIVFNHIMIYRREAQTGPQVLIASKQIYANHYYNSSLGLAAFVNIPGANPGSYLFYENRSRTDGLEGVLGKFKRGIVEHRAIDSLKGILETSRASLNARLSNPTEPTEAAPTVPSWKRWKIGRVYVVLCLVLITALFGLFAFGNSNWKRGFKNAQQ